MSIEENRAEEAVQETAAEETVAETDASTEEPEAEQTEQAEQAVSEEQTEQEGQAEEGAAGAVAEETEVVPPSYAFVVDGEETQFTEEQIVQAVEGSRRWDDFSDNYDKMLRIAASIGAESVDAALDQLVASYADHVQKKAVADAKGNATVAEELASSRKSAIDKRVEEMRGSYAKKKAETAEAKKASTNERLATEFIALHEEFPEFADFKDVPKSIVNAALKGGISLLDAKLRFDRAEAKKVAAAAAQESAAAKSSVGTQKGTESGSPNSAVQSALDDFWKALK